MAKITLQQGEVTAELSGLCYLPETSGLEGNSDYVIAEVITADADIVLTNGSAILSDGKEEYTVEVAVMICEGAEKSEEREGPICEIEISSTEEGGLIKVALALELLGHYTEEQLRALLNGTQLPE